MKLIIITQIIRSNDRYLSDKDKIKYYIDLFYQILKHQIQFDQSMKRPLIPNACFDKARLFKKLCENILISFGKENVCWITIKTTKSIKDKNGNTVSQYIKNKTRSQSIVDWYQKSLDNIKNIIKDATSNYTQRAILMHLNWMNQEFESGLSHRLYNTCFVCLLSVFDTFDKTHSSVFDSININLNK